MVRINRRVQTALLLGAAFLACGRATALQAATPSPEGGRYLTEAGSPLPFANDEEVLRFMATAQETSWEYLPTGVTRPKRLVLEGDGVRIRAVFHYIDREARETKRLPNGNVVQYFRDSYRNQAAAYVVARHLGLNNVPPTLLRTSGGQIGSAQLWIENAMMERDRVERGIRNPKPALYRQKYFEMRVFDNIINNIDRNQTNILLDSDWNLWMIDHTRTFGRDKALAFPEMIQECSRGLWQALNDLDEKELRLALKAYLGAYEINAVIGRARKVTKILQKRIAQLGEEKVLFTPGEIRAEATIEPLPDLPPG